MSRTKDVESQALLAWLNARLAELPPVPVFPVTPRAPAPDSPAAAPTPSPRTPRTLKPLTQLSDLSDSVALIMMCEQILGRRVGRFWTEGVTAPRIKKIDNANLLLKILKEINVRATSGAEDIADCNEKQLLGLCWAIVRRCSLAPESNLPGAVGESCRINVALQQQQQQQGQARAPVPGLSPVTAPEVVVVARPTEEQMQEIERGTMPKLPPLRIHGEGEDDRSKEETVVGMAATPPPQFLNVTMLPESPRQEGPNRSASTSETSPMQSPRTDNTQVLSHEQVLQQQALGMGQPELEQTRADLPVLGARAASDHAAAVERVADRDQQLVLPQAQAEWKLTPVTAFDTLHVATARPSPPIPEPVNQHDVKPQTPVSAARMDPAVLSPDNGMLGSAPPPESAPPGARAGPAATPQLAVPIAVGMTAIEKPRVVPEVGPPPSPTSLALKVPPPPSPRDTDAAPLEPLDTGASAAPLGIPIVEAASAVAPLGATPAAGCVDPPPVCESSTTPLSLPQENDVVPPAPPSNPQQPLMSVPPPMMVPPALGGVAPALGVPLGPTIDGAPTVAPALGIPIAAIETTRMTEKSPVPEATLGNPLGHPSQADGQFLAQQSQVSMVQDPGRMALAQGIDPATAQQMMMAGYGMDPAVLQYMQSQGWNLASGEQQSAADSQAAAAMQQMVQQQYQMQMAMQQQQQAPIPMRRQPSILKQADAEVYRAPSQSESLSGLRRTVETKPTGEAFLYFKKDGKLQSFKLHAAKRVVTIGRHSEVDIQITKTDQSISRWHATVTAMPTAKDVVQFVFKDNSTYGSFVNERQVSDCELQDGDKIFLGTSEEVILFIRPNTCAHPEFEGAVTKHCSTFPRWQGRWMCLSRDLLFYFKGRDNALPMGVIDLHGVLVNDPPKPRNSFMVVTQGKPYHFCAKSAAEKATWMSTIEKAIAQARSNPSQYIAH